MQCIILEESRAWNMQFQFIFNQKREIDNGHSLSQIIMSGAILM